jgi:hypothetical protein
MDAETFKTPKQQFSNTLISYETYKIDIEPFSFSENGSWDITDYDGLISILRANKFLAIVTDFTVTNGKAYPLKWAADDGSFRQFTIKSLTTEEQDGYIHLTIEALSTDFTII